MKQQLIIYISIATGLLLSWTFLLFIPELNDNARLEQEINTAEQTIIQFRHEVAQLPGILETKVILSEESARQTQDLFSCEQVIDLLEKIGRKCNSYKLDIQEVRPPVEELILMHQRIPTSTQPQFLNITLVLEGKFSRFGQFVTELERAPYFRGVNYSRLQSAPVSNSQSQFLIEFKVLLGRTA